MACLHLSSHSRTADTSYLGKNRHPTTLPLMQFPKWASPVSPSTARQKSTAFSSSSKPNTVASRSSSQPWPRFSAGPGKQHGAAPGSGFIWKALHEQRDNDPEREPGLELAISYYWRGKNTQTAAVLAFESSCNKSEANDQTRACKFNFFAFFLIRNFYKVLGHLIAISNKL